MTPRPGSHHKGTTFEVRPWEEDAAAGATLKAFGRAKPWGSSRPPAPPQPLQRHPSDSKPRHKAGSMPSYFSAQRGKKEKANPAAAGGGQHLPSRARGSRGEGSRPRRSPACSRSRASSMLAPRAHAASSPRASSGSPGSGEAASSSATGAETCLEEWKREAR